MARSRVGSGLGEESTELDVLRDPGRAGRAAAQEHRALSVPAVAAAGEHPERSQQADRRGPAAHPIACWSARRSVGRSRALEPGSGDDLYRGRHRAAHREDAEVSRTTRPTGCWSRGSPGWRVEEFVARSNPSCVASGPIASSDTGDLESVEVDGADPQRRPSSSVRWWPRAPRLSDDLQVLVAQRSTIRRSSPIWSRSNLELDRRRQATRARDELDVPERSASWWLGQLSRRRVEALEDRDARSSEKVQNEIEQDAARVHAASAARGDPPASSARERGQRTPRASSDLREKHRRCRS